MELLRKRIIKNIKHICGLHSSQTLCLENIIKKIRLVVGIKIYKKKYNTKDIIEGMVRLGLREGSHVFLHSSWNEFYNYEGTEEELIQGIIDVIGEKGTLAMPAFPLLRKGKIFDVRKTVTGAGLLAEAFRKFPGVKRSYNVHNSVCVWGAQQDYLIREHHLSEVCWDEKSPYYKLGEIEAQVFSLGLSKYFVGSILHCTEGILRKENSYFASFFDTKNSVIYDYIDYSGCLNQYKCFENNPNVKRLFKDFTGLIIKKYFDPKEYASLQISNLVISKFNAKYTINRLLELGRKGIVMYKSPRTKGYIFK